MAIHGTTRLDTGDRFPDLQVSRLGGGSLAGEGGDGEDEE